MATLSLRINVVEKNVTKTLQFDPTTTVYDACRVIRKKISEADQGQPQDYGLFLADEDLTKGVWLEPIQKLDYYILKNGDLLEYRKKMRPLRVRMLDGTVKTLLVDDSQAVASLMVVICTKIGITNHDEYGLVRENQEEEQENKPYFGTLTLKRKKEDKERDSKMDQLRKKIRTDDEVNWIDPTKTLREQGVDESETVLLLRKYFFSDQNIDSRDPVELNLLYVQARDAILGGTHPVTQEKACEFAGIQCHVQFGDHDDTKHRPGFLDLKEFLPQSYVKMKNIEKKVFFEHKKHAGLSEIDAKALYTKTARALKTYGVTFFLVKEKMKGKNKLAPRLLGVTKESVLRLDENTKEILKTWPLTTVRRWGASPNTFTLDFGDYSDQYYSVQTTEGEQIVQLISGYIDIILKKQQAKDHLGTEGDEGSTMVEDTVMRHRANIMQHETSNRSSVNTESLAKRVSMHAGVEGNRPLGLGHMGDAQHITTSGRANLAHGLPTVQQTKVTSVLTEPQKALLSTISAGHEVIDTVQKDLDTRAQLPELGSDPSSLKWKETTLDMNRQNVSSQIAAMNVATSQMMAMLWDTTDEIDNRAVGATVTTITTNLPEMARGVRMIAALTEDESSGDKLLQAARELCVVYSDLLKAAEPKTAEPRQNLLEAASRVGDVSRQVLVTIDANDEMQDMLPGLASEVASTMDALVRKAKDIASTIEDQATQDEVLKAATHCELVTSQLVACAKVVAPTLHNSACQEQLVAAAREVAHALSVCQEHLPQLGQASAEVKHALHDMLSHVKRGARGSVHESAVEDILVATDQVLACTGDTAEMVRQTKVLNKATSQLIQAIKSEAESQPDLELRRRLLAAAEALANATTHMMESARLCASNPHDAQSQSQLGTAVEQLRAATTAAATPVLRRKVIERLEAVAKQAASTATQCIAAAQGAAQHNSNKASQEQLSCDCKAMANMIKDLVEGIKGTLSKPDNPAAQLTLINASEQFLQPGARVVQSASAVLPTVADQAAAQQLNTSAQQLSAALSDLRSTLNRAREVCGSLELDSASELIHNLQADLEAFQRSAERNELGPLPGETTESAALKLGSTSKNVDSAMSHLLSAAVQGNENYTRIAARNTWSALRDFTTSVRGVAATTHDQDTQKMILASAMEVMEQSLQLIEEVRQAMQGKGNPVNAQKLTYASKNVSQALNKCVGSLPGQKDVEEAIQSIANALQILDRDEFPPSSKPCGQLQQELSSSAASLNDASAALVSSVHNPTQLAVSSRTFDTAFRDVLGRSTEVAGQTKDKEMQGQMMVSLKNVFLVSSKLLATAKSVAADPSAPNAKNQLAEAARAVTDSINHLIDVCTLASPGQKECDNAIREIHSLRPLLDSPTEPHNDFTYFECLDTITEKAKSLGDGMAGIANHAKKSELEELGRAVKMVSNAVCTLVEATAQAAYLVGVSDPSSVAARPGLVDQAQFARAAQAIHTACQHLTNQQQALTAATVIAKHASALCNACRTASSKTTNPVAKRHFLQAAKDVANCTSDLVEKIKALDKEFSDHNRENCTSAMKPLLDAIDDLCTFGGYPEFASQPAKISAEAQLAQEPILESGRTIIHDSCSIMQVVKSLAVTPRDSPTWQQLANHSKGVSESIKKLVTSIRDKAPGQKDCDEAIEKLSALIRVLDQASLAAVSQSLSPRRDHNLQGFTEQTQSSSREIEERLESVRTAGKFEAENICHAVNQMVLYFEPLVAGAIGAASNMVHSKQQMELLDQTKTVTECALQLVVATKEGGGNRKAVHIHPGIDEAVDATRNALKDVGVTLEHLATQAGMVTGILDSITRAMTRVTNNSRRLSTHSENEELSFVDYQTRMVVASKEVARTAQDMAVKCAIDPGRLGALSAELSRLYVQLATDATGAAAATPNAEVASRILSGIQELGRACQEVVKLGSTCQVAQKEVADSARHVSQKVSQVLVALQAGSRGTQACINASGTVSGIIGDLDATVMVAMAGTLNAENEDESFVDHRDKIIKMAGMLAKDTNSLVTGAVSSQEQLAVAAQNTVSTIVQLAEFVKFGAASLGPNNPDAQVMLINAVKDVSSALSDLILATKTASGKNVNDPSMNHLKDSEKIMMTSITSLLKTVKAVEDEHTRGRCALESTIEAITQEIRILQSPEQQKIHATPEELVRCTKVITVATAKAVAASSSGKQDDIIAAANMGRKAMSDMLTICKATANSADGEKLRMRTLQAGNGVAVQYRELLQIILQIVTRPGGATDAKQNLSSVSRNIAQCITELVTSAELLKGSNWEDPDDPTVIAENELLGAAASIEAAAKKLASLRPRRQMQEVDESLNFDEMILEAAKSIATANSALLRAATAAQRELVEQGKVSRSPLTSSDDGQWSEGLISAARLVAAATHSLVESANSLVQGMACEDMLISSAKKVASSTAQLILACKVKADPDADSTKRLQSAGNAVKRATDSLVKAAQQAMKQEEQRSLVLDTGMVPRIKQEMNALADVLRIERELEDARNRLTAIRQAKYKSKPES